MRYLLLPMFLSVSVWAEEISQPESIDQALSFIPVIVQAILSGQYLIAGAGTALVLTFIVRKYLLPRVGLGHGVLPIVSAILGLFAGVGLAILGGAPLDSAMLAVMSGPLASILWDSVFKYFVKK